MAKLIIANTAASGEATIGGKPSAPIGTIWPKCQSCAGEMQFLAQLPLSECDSADLSGRNQCLLIFQCQNDPGMCDEWDADCGGNAAILIPDSGRMPLPVPEGETLLPAESRLTFQPYDDSAMSETSDDAYCAAVEADGANVLGKIEGRPVWLQDDETPKCDCGAEMGFFAQLEDRGGGGINFGDGGVGYAFVCGSCPESAKFLWQD